MLRQKGVVNWFGCVLYETIMKIERMMTDMFSLRNYFALIFVVQFLAWIAMNCFTNILLLQLFRNYIQIKNVFITYLRHICQKNNSSLKSNLKLIQIQNRQIMHCPRHTTKFEVSNVEFGLFEGIVDFLIALPVKLDLELYNKKEMNLHNEAQIFEDINRFIQLFKKGLTFLELIIQNAKKKDELKVYIEKQKNSLAEILQLAQKYSQQTECLNINQNTYLRFCNRLIETISLMKIQQLCANNPEFMHYLTETLKKLQKAVKTNQQQRKFKQLIGDTYWLFLNVCSKLEAHLFKEQNLSGSKSCQKLKQKGQQVMINRKIQHLKRDEDSIFYKIKNDSLEKIIKNQPRPQMTRINKTVGNINARYDTLKCLDIDYQYFKSSTFDAMQRSVLFQKQYLCRNQESLRFVKDYMDDFLLFQKKRELKINRKNRRVNSQTEPDYLGSINSFLQEVRQRKSYLKLIKNKMNQTMNQRTILDKWSRGKDEQTEKNNQLKKIFTNQSNKTLYNPKNQFLIFGKRQTKHTDKMGRKDDKKSQKKVLQTHSINLSIFHEDSDQRTHWQSQKPFVQHKSVKKQLENPVILRFQQQLQQVPKEDCSQQEKESLISSPMKKVMRSKDGQLNLGKMTTEPSQPQNFVFKDRVVKYRTKIEPKLRNIIFNSKQL